MKKLIAKIIVAFMAFGSCMATPMVVYATEKVDAEDTEVIEENTDDADKAKDEELGKTDATVKYTVEDANLFEGASLEDSILGVIKEGNPVEITGESGEMYAVSYLGINGYIEKRVVEDTFKGYIESQTDDETLLVESNTLPDPLLPASHYVDVFEETENMAAVSYLMDEDYSDDYVYVCDSTKIKVTGILINTAFQNGCPGFTVIYTEDKMSPTLYIKISSKEMEADDVVELSFSYESGVVTFLNSEQELSVDVEIGVPTDVEVVKVTQDGKQLEKVEEAEEQVEYYKIQGLSEVTITVKEADKAEETKEVEEDGQSTWPVVIIIVVSVVLIVAVVLAVFKKRKNKKG